MNFLTHVKNYIIHNSLITKGDCVIIGISGGSDSVCLTLVLNELKYELGYRIHLAHFNHNLRKSSVKDEEFVRDFAYEHSLSLSVETWETPPKENDSSIEEKSRNRRMQFLEKVAGQHNTHTIALAHHIQDVGETVLMNMLRGTGMSGLRGILPIRKLGDCRFIRPLLSMRKEDIMDYLSDSNVTFVEDPLNTNIDFFRNRIRHHLIPLLEQEYADHIHDKLFSMSQILSADYDFLRIHCDEVFERITIVEDNISVSFDLIEIKNQHISERRMLYRKAYTTLIGNTNTITYKHLQSIDNLLKNKHGLNLPNKVYVEIKHNSLCFSIS